jgi:hypothetical protein
MAEQQPFGPTRLVMRKELKLWPRAELQGYYDRIGKIAGPERLDDVRVVQVVGDDCWIEVTTTRLVGDPG